MNYRRLLHAMLAVGVLASGAYAASGEELPRFAGYDFCVPGTGAAEAEDVSGWVDPVEADPAMRLFRRALEGDLDAVHKALSEGAKVDFRTEQGASYLHAALKIPESPSHRFVPGKRLGIVEAFIAAGADVNARIDGGKQNFFVGWQTPLHVVASWRFAFTDPELQRVAEEEQLAIIDTLIAHRAESTMDFNTQTPYAVAQSRYSPPFGHGDSVTYSKEANERRLALKLRASAAVIEKLRIHTASMSPSSERFH